MIKAFIKIGIQYAGFFWISAMFRMFRVGTKDDCLFRYLSDFQNWSLFEGFNLLKYSAKRMSDTTLFLASLNFAK